MSGFINVADRTIAPPAAKAVEKVLMIYSRHARVEAERLQNASNPTAGLSYGQRELHIYGAAMDVQAGKTVILFHNGHLGMILNNARTGTRVLRPSSDGVLDRAGKGHWAAVRKLELYHDTHGNEFVRIKMITWGNSRKSDDGQLPVGAFLTYY